MRESARWPVVARAGEPEARDPAGDDRVPPDLGWSDHLRCWGSGDPASYRDDALRFLDAVRFFGRLEGLITAVTGAEPRAEDARLAQRGGSQRSSG